MGQEDPLLLHQTSLQTSLVHTCMQYKNINIFLRAHDANKFSRNSYSISFQYYDSYINEDS